MLYLLAAGLVIALGIAHSYLGEKYILSRLFRAGVLPKVFSRPASAERTLRFAWHLTTLAWCGAGAMFFLLALGPLEATAIPGVLAAVFLATGAVTAYASRGRHFAWPVFVLIGLIALYGTQA